MMTMLPLPSFGKEALCGETVSGCFSVLLVVVLQVFAGTGSSRNMWENFGVCLVIKHYAKMWLFCVIRSNISFPSFVTSERGRGPQIEKKRKVFLLLCHRKEGLAGGKRK